MKDIQELQRYVLGCFMLEDCFYRAEPLLHDDCFDGGLLRNVYHCIKALHTKGAKTDIVSVCNEYRKDNSGLNSYDIVAMTNMVNNTSNLEFHCMNLKEYAVSVQLKKHTDVVSHLIASGAPLDVLDSAQSELNRIAQLAYDNVNDSYNSSISKVLEEIGQRVMNGGNVHGIPSGIASLDKATGGFHKSDLVILAARPGMGKTALVLEIAKGAADYINKNEEKGAVAIASLEMSTRQLIERLIIADAEVDNERVKKGDVTKKEYESLCASGGYIQSLPIEVSDKQGQTISQLRSFCMKVKHEKGLSMIVVDYLQLMKDPDYKGDKTGEITAISQSLKGLAKDFNVPVIALSQLSRAVESRGGDKVPMLSDLRDSGAIEQDADMVAFIYRPEYYGITQDEEGNSTEGRADFLIRKHRNGALADVYLRFKGKYMKFQDWAHDFDNSTHSVINNAITQGNYSDNLEPNF